MFQYFSIANRILLCKCNFKIQLVFGNTWSNFELKNAGWMSFEVLFIFFKEMCLLTYAIAVCTVKTPDD